MHRTRVIDEMREWFTPLLEQLRCSPAAVDCKSGLMIEPHFPTKGRPLDYQVCRVDPSVYDEFVVGYESKLVWLGSTLRSKIAPTAAEQERLEITTGSHRRQMCSAGHGQPSTGHSRTPPTYAVARLFRGKTCREPRGLCRERRVSLVCTFVG
jgi:hypothetical protein